MLVSLLAGLGALFVYLGGIWLGWLVLGRPREHGPRRDLLVAGWAGWYLQATIVLTLGWLGRLGPTWLALVVLVPLGLAVVDRQEFVSWARGAIRDYRDALRAPWWVGLVAVLGLGWLALQLLAPPFHYDLLTYGFGQPMHWLAEGRIAPLGPDAYAYEAVPARMHFLLGLGLFGERMVGLSLLLWTVSGALLLARALHLSRPGAGGWPLMLATALVLTPGVWDLLLLRKDDLAVLWGGGALLVLFLGWSGARPSRGECALLVLTGAATLAAKPGVTAGLVAAATIGAVWRTDFAGRTRGWLLGTLAAGGLVALLPVAVHTWLGLGHPLAAVAPYLGRYPLASTRWYSALADAFPWEPQPLTRWLPYTLGELARFYDPSRWNFGDNFGLLVLIGLPLAVLTWRRPPLIRIWLAGMLGWYLTFHWPRFALALLPLTLFLIGDLLRRYVSPRLMLVLLCVVAALHVWFYSALTVTGSRIFVPAVQAAFRGAGGSRDFVPPSVEICEEANRRLAAGTHRMLFVGETRCYPCRVPFDYWNAHFRHPFERLTRGEAPEQRWDRHVAERGITHIVYSPQVARRHMEWSETMHLRLERWLQLRGTVLARSSDRESTTLLIELRER